MAKSDPRKRAERVAAIIASINVVPLNAIRLDRIIRGDPLPLIAAPNVPEIIISINAYQYCTQFYVSRAQRVMKGSNQGPRRTRGGDNLDIQLSEADRLFC